MRKLKAAETAIVGARKPRARGRWRHAQVSIALAGLSHIALAAGPYGERLEGFTYPYPVANFQFQSQQQALEMAYMDVHPDRPNGMTAVLLHGKNFCAATWQSTIETLRRQGYRVVAPDQLGFCRSSKPAHYQYSFQQLARNTHALLESLGVSRPILVAHSTGGMIAVRYALMYPRETRALMLVDPIGLEDWKAQGVPSQSIDEWYARELKTNADSIRRYERSTYYGGEWRESFEVWVDMLAGLNDGPGKERVAWNSAALYDMIYTQPVIYEFKNLSVPTTLFIGDKDTSAIGKDLAPPAVAAQLGHYPTLGKQAAELIPGCRLIEFAELGHAPQIQDPDQFHRALLAQLQTLPP